MCVSLVCLLSLSCLSFQCRILQLNLLLMFPYFSWVCDNFLVFPCFQWLWWLWVLLDVQKNRAFSQDYVSIRRSEEEYPQEWNVHVTSGPHDMPKKSLVILVFILGYSSVGQVSLLSSYFSCCSYLILWKPVIRLNQCTLLNSVVGGVK